MGRRKKARRLPSQGCLLYKRNQVANRPNCMIAPQLGVEDFRVLVMGSLGWKDWDAMQFAFDALKEQIDTTMKRVVVVHTGLGGAARMASTMVKARYGWNCEVHQSGWSAREMRFAVRHMLKLGVDYCLIFQEDNPASLDAEVVDRICDAASRAKDMDYRIVHPLPDLERLARKAFVDPPKLGE